MISQIVSIFDVAASAFSRPVFVGTVGLGVRSFTDEVNRPGPNNEVNRHPADFSLYHLGHFDDSVGLFVLLASPVLVCRAFDVVVDKV